MSDENYYCFSQDVDPDPETAEESPPLAPSKPRPNLQPCVCCGELSENRWCSNSCFITEDGFDEEAWR
jgi:hypothetical protein